LNGVNGLHGPLAEGAFYAFVDGRETGLDALDLADRLLQEAHVAVVPGTAFGDLGEGHFRLSFATDDDSLTQAVQRIGEVLGRR
jgi:aspartate/methionine/tyrosine aminotransferase